VIRLIDSQGRVVHSALSNDQGEFGVRAIAAGAYRLVASKPGFLDGAFGAKAAGRPGISLVLQPGESRLLKLELSRGASISGVVRTPAGEPLVGATVRVLVRRRAGDGFALTVARAGLHEVQVDESGRYRAFGLLPGEYVVGANTGLSAAGTPARRTAQRIGVTPSSVEPREAGGQEMLLAPGFYPGVSNPLDADLIRVSAGQERDSIDITLRESVSLELSGTVVDEAGTPVPAARITLVPADPYLPASSIAGAVGSGTATSRGGLVNVTSSTSGRFQINGLTPRRYVLLARAGTDKEPQMAKVVIDLQSDLSQNITVGLLAPVQGTAVFHGKGPQPVTYGPVRVESVEAGLAVNPAPFTVENGRFVLRNALPGRYRLIAANTGPWFLASARIDGHDVLDEGLVIQSPRDVSQLELQFTDTPSQIAGTLVDESGQPASDYVVVVFAADRRWWREGSRRIAAGRPRSDGSFSFVNLPAGTYLIAALTDVEQDEWFAASFLEAIGPASVRINVKEGQTTQQSFRIAGK
jgi:protocatechuate 3,4-dioxygenase beta subunit